MKRRAKIFFALLLAVLTVVTNFTLGLTALNASAAKLTSGIFTYEIVDEEVRITYCDADASGEIVVPSHIDGYPVTTIGENAFGSVIDIPKITLPDTVVVIENYALSSEISEIDFGDSVTKIEELYLGTMSVVEFPDSLIVLEEQTIYGADVFIGNNLRYIGDDLMNLHAKSFTVSDDNPYYKSVDGVLFSKDGKTLIRYPAKSSSTSYSLPSSVETIHSFAFYGSSNLVQVNISDSVRNIEDYSFKNCVNLNDISIGRSIEKVGFEAFKNTAVYNNASSWINGILYVDGCAITYNSSLPKNTVIKNGTRLIAQQCFANAPFETVDIPDTVKYICDYAFESSALVSIEIPDSVVGLGISISSCDNLKSVIIGDGVKALLDDSITSDNVTSISLGKGVEYISGDAFWTTAFINDKTNYNGEELIVDGCLIRIDYNTNGNYHIGKDIRCIAENVFAGCRGITSFSVDKNNMFYSTDEHGVLYNKDQTILVAFPCKLNLTEYTVPSTVKKISEYAFANNNPYLKTINLPDGLEEIGRKAFYADKTLENINFPADLKKIGEYAFHKCEKLQKVNMLEGIAYIGERAFQECKAIKEISIPNSVKYIGEHAFYGCPNIETVKIGKGLNTIASQVFDNCKNIKTLILTNYVDLIEDSAFGDSDSLTDIYYTGTEEQWRAIILERYAVPDSATIHYNHVIDDEPEVHKHSYSSTVTTEPTCESYGVRTYTCSCGKSYTERIEKADHALGDWVITQNPTVADFGKKVQYCSVCKNAFNETNVDKLPSSSYIDGSTGIEIIYPSDNSDFTAEIIMLTNGVEQDSSGRYVKYEIRFAASGVVQIKIPVPAGFIRNRTVGGFNSADGSRPGVFNVRYENGYLIFTVDRAGTFTVLEAKETYRGEIRTPSTTKISYGDSIILHLDANMALPSGYRVVWSASNNNFDYTVSADGTTCTITPSKSGDTTFTVTVYDGNNNAVSEDTQVMKSKAGFFDKLIAFFKKLFGLTKVIQQSIDTFY